MVDATTTIPLLITAISGGIATIIYAFKNVKRSECCGCECEQRTAKTPPSSLKQVDAIIEEEPTINIKINQDTAV